MAQQQSDRAGAAPGGTATPAAGTAGTGAVPDPAAVAATRRAWHGVAELIMAGPQYRRSATIRLDVRPGGFGTVAEPQLRVQGAELFADEARIALRGASFAEIAGAVGVDVGAPADLYHDGSGVAPDEPIDVDAAAAAYLGDCFVLGDSALRRFAPDETPVLWPEHFDVGVTIEGVNYGVSLGDSYLTEPYAYVGPWKVPDPRNDSFWNAPFGAAQPLQVLSTVDGVAAFFAEGARQAGGAEPGARQAS